MAERVKIGNGSWPFRVLDSSGYDEPLASLFDANYRVLRGPFMKGIVPTPASSTGYVAEVSYGQTFARPPMFMMYGTDGSGTNRIAIPYNLRSHDNTTTFGHSARGFSNRLELMNWYNNFAVTFYYLVLKTLAPA